MEVVESQDPDFRISLNETQKEVLMNMQCCVWQKIEDKTPKNVGKNTSVLSKKDCISISLQGVKVLEDKGNEDKEAFMMTLKAIWDRNRQRTREMRTDPFTQISFCAISLAFQMYTMTKLEQNGIGKDRWDSFDEVVEMTRCFQNLANWLKNTASKVECYKGTKKDVLERFCTKKYYEPNGSFKQTLGIFQFVPYEPQKDFYLRHKLASSQAARQDERGMETESDVEEEVPAAKRRELSADEKFVAECTPELQYTLKQFQCSLVKPIARYFRDRSQNPDSAKFGFKYIERIANDFSYLTTQTKQQLEKIRKFLNGSFGLSEQSEYDALFYMLTTGVIILLTKQLDEEGLKHVQEIIEDYAQNKYSQVQVRKAEKDFQCFLDSDEAAKSQARNFMKGQAFYRLFLRKEHAAESASKPVKHKKEPTAPSLSEKESKKASKKSEHAPKPKESEKEKKMTREQVEKEAKLKMELTRLKVDMNSRYVDPRSGFQITEFQRNLNQDENAKIFLSELQRLSIRLMIMRGFGTGHKLISRKLDKHDLSILANTVEQYWINFISNGSDLGYDDMIDFLVYLRNRYYRQDSTNIVEAVVYFYSLAVIDILYSNKQHISNRIIPNHIKIANCIVKLALNRLKDYNKAQDQLMSALIVQGDEKQGFFQFMSQIPDDQNNSFEQGAFDKKPNPPPDQAGDASGQESDSDEENAAEAKRGGDRDEKDAAEAKRGGDRDEKDAAGAKRGSDSDEENAAGAKRGSDSDEEDAAVAKRGGDSDEDTQLPRKKTGIRRRRRVLPNDSDEDAEGADDARADNPKDSEERMKRSKNSRLNKKGVLHSDSEAEMSGEEMKAKPSKRDIMEKIAKKYDFKVAPLVPQDWKESTDKKNLVKKWKKRWESRVNRIEEEMNAAGYPSIEGREISEQLLDSYQAELKKAKNVTFRYYLTQIQKAAFQSLIESIIKVTKNRGFIKDISERKITKMAQGILNKRNKDDIVRLSEWMNMLWPLLCSYNNNPKIGNNMYHPLLFYVSKAILQKAAHISGKMDVEIFRMNQAIQKLYTDQVMEELGEFKDEMEGVQGGAYGFLKLFEPVHELPTQKVRSGSREDDADDDQQPSDAEEEEDIPEGLSDVAEHYEFCVAPKYQNTSYSEWHKQWKERLSQVQEELKKKKIETLVPYTEEDEDISNDKDFWDEMDKQ